MKRILLFLCLLAMGLTGAYADVTLSFSQLDGVSYSYPTYTYTSDDGAVGCTYGTSQDYSANENVIVLAYTVNGSVDDFTLNIEYYNDDTVDSDLTTTANAKKINDYQSGEDIVTVMLLKARLNRTYASNVAKIYVSAKSGDNIAIQKASLDSYYNCYDLSTGDAKLPTGGGTYRITGDGSASGNTIEIQDTEEYTIYLDGVTIDTTNRSAKSDGKRRTTSYYTLETGSVYNSGIYIPEGANVTIYVEDDNSVKGSVYGIYAGSNASWKLCPLGNNLSTIWIGSTQLVDYTVDATSTIDIEGGTYGIANEGGYLNIQGCKVANGYDSPESDGNSYFGYINITANDCGIYSKNGALIDDVTMKITVNGTGEVTVNDNPTTADDAPGYTITKLVCGIYVENKSDQTNALNVAVTYLTIVASQEHTYGVFLNNGDSGDGAFFGYGLFSITATQCVLHHEHENGSYTLGGAEYMDKSIFMLHGPFCSHYVYGNGTYDRYWYCDETSTFGGSTYGSNTAWIIYDEDATTSGYNLNGEASYSEVQYVDRKLYTGWNTICLPFRYDLNRSDDPYESDEYVSDYSSFASK